MDTHFSASGEGNFFDPEKGCMLEGATADVKQRGHLPHGSWGFSGTRRGFLRSAIDSNAKKLRGGLPCGLSAPREDRG